ncbi:hypothetical protein BC332_31196 [Capsicum chinense]|nr:hypothetical protein BC332_31196 [Capsicum chinense]
MSSKQGAVGLRMRVYDRTVCFANFHFAAHLEVVGRRNADFDHVYRSMIFSRPLNFLNAAAGMVPYLFSACLHACLFYHEIAEAYALWSSGKAGFTDGIGSGDHISIPQESNKVDEIMDISLDVLHNSSLNDALQKFFQPEVLDGNNKYKCERRRWECYVRKIVDLIIAESLFSWQGGLIILLQIDTCNTCYCDGFTPNSGKKPKIWTENWDGCDLNNHESTRVFKKSSES